MSILRTLRVSATGLTAERMRMDIISNNVANSQTTRTEEGGAFRRKQVVFEERGQTRRPPMGGQRSGDISTQSGLAGVRVRQIVEDQEDLVRTYDPSHPDADEEGFVEYPNVDITTEMVDLMAASKAYSANITVIQTTKSMAQAALQIGNR